MTNKKLPTHYEILEHIDSIFGEAPIYTTDPLVESTTAGCIGVNLGAKPKKTKKEDESLEESVDFEDVVKVLEECESDDEIDALLEKLDSDTIELLETHYNSDEIFVEFISALESIEDDAELEEVLESLDDDELQLIESYYADQEVIEEGEDTPDFLDAANNIAEELEEDKDND